MILPILNLLIKFTRCSVTTGGHKISIQWKLGKNLLRWDLRDRDAMLTTRPGEKILYLKRFPHQLKHESR
jgi:hypothetical protein